jgi:hypothetical protein
MQSGCRWSLRCLVYEFFLLGVRVFESDLSIPEWEDVAALHFDRALRSGRCHHPFRQTAIAGDEVLGSIEPNIGHP